MNQTFYYKKQLFQKFWIPVLLAYTVVFFLVLGKTSLVKSLLAHPVIPIILYFVGVGLVFLLSYYLPAVSGKIIITDGTIKRYSFFGTVFSLAAPTVSDVCNYLEGRDASYLRRRGFLLKAGEHFYIIPYNLIDEAKFIETLKGFSPSLSYHDNHGLNDMDSDFRNFIRSYHLKWGVISIVIGIFAVILLTLALRYF